MPFEAHEQRQLLDDLSGGQPVGQLSWETPAEQLFRYCALSHIEGLYAPAFYSNMRFQGISVLKSGLQTDALGETEFDHLLESIFFHEIDEMTAKTVTDFRIDLIPVITEFNSQYPWLETEHKEIVSRLEELSLYKDDPAGLIRIYWAIDRQISDRILTQIDALPERMIVPSDFNRIRGVIYLFGNMLRETTGEAHKEVVSVVRRFVSQHNVFSVDGIHVLLSFVDALVDNPDEVIASIHSWLEGYSISVDESVVVSESVYDFREKDFILGSLSQYYADKGDLDSSIAELSKMEDPSLTFDSVGPIVFALSVKSDSESHERKWQQLMSMFDGPHAEYAKGKMVSEWLRYMVFKFKKGIDITSARIPEWLTTDELLSFMHYEMPEAICVAFDNTQVYNLVVRKLSLEMNKWNDGMLWLEKDLAANVIERNMLLEALIAWHYESARHGRFHT